MRAPVAAGLAAALLLPGTALARPSTGLIVEGRSMAGVALGDTRARAARILGPLTDCRPTFDRGTSCEAGRENTTFITFDPSWRVSSISNVGRLTVSRQRVAIDLAREVFATRQGVGAGLRVARLASVYGSRLRLAPGPGEGRRLPLVVTGPAGGVTVFDSVGSRSVGQVTAVTVARLLTPALSVAPAAVGPGGTLTVRARGLLGKAPYRLSLHAGRREVDLLLSVRATQQGTLELPLSHDLMLEEALIDLRTSAATPVRLRLEALDDVGADAVPARPGRPFWLGSVRLETATGLAPVVPTIAPEDPAPVDLSQGLRVRIGGARPSVVQTLEDWPVDGIAYAVQLDACRLVQLAGPVVDGVLVVPAAISAPGNAGTGCTRGPTAPTERVGTLTLIRRNADGDERPVATGAITYRVDTS